MEKTMKSAHSAYTPSQRSAESLEQLFVVREPIAQRIIESIKASVSTANKHNTLLVGPRGIGKTHLISIIHNRLCTDQSLTDQLQIAWLPEDSYIASYNGLLFQIIQTLNNVDPSAELDEKLDQLLDLNSTEQQIFAEQLLLSQIKQTLLIIAENMDELLKNIDIDGQQKFRALIQTHPVFTLLGSATRLSEAIATQDFPFYGFFNSRLLTPFSVENAVLMLSQLATAEGNQALADILHSPTGKARVQALHYLAGGNPRVYTVFFDCLTCENLDDLVRPFMKLIDNMTPYYQSHMSRLAPLQRNIIDALRKIRGAATVKAVARQIMREPTAVSTQIGKLEKLGFVQRVYSSGRNNYYELQEPIMRLCLDVKEQRGDNIELFIEFLRIWHSPKELDTLRTADHYANSSYLNEAIERAHKQSDPLAEVFDEQTKDYLDPNHDEDTLAHIEAALERDPDNIEYLERKAHCIRVDGGDLMTQLACWQAVTERDPNYVLALHWQAALSFDLAKYKQAKMLYEKATALTPDDADMYIDYAKCLFKLKKNKQAEIVLDKGFKLQGQPETARQWHQRGNAFYGIGNYQATRNAYFNALLADYEYLPVWSHLLWLLSESGEKSNTKKICQWAASAMPNNAILYRHLGIEFGRTGAIDKALPALEQAIKLFNERGVIQDEKNFVKTTNYLAYCLNLTGQHKKALQLFAVKDNYLLKISTITFDRDVEYAHTLLSLDRWDEGLNLLKISLKSHSIAEFRNTRFWPISALIDRSQNSEKWRRFITAYINIFTDINQLPILGQIIVHSLRSYNKPLITNDVAIAWNDIWQTLGADIKAFTIPLRLLAAATDYKVTGKQTALLTLAKEERGLLTPWFTNLIDGDKSEAVAALSREIDDLLVQLDQKHAEKVNHQ